MTALAVGKDAIAYAKIHREEMDWDESKIYNFIMPWAEKIGEENVVFFRESDEDNYPMIWGTTPPFLENMEYH